ncbi:hypothetical protein VC116063_002487 [Vibrio cholerae O1 str. 116063]|nr:hypothetical protein VC116063_002487 [Vibrio cholerae O1 str. 116063]
MVSLTSPRFTSFLSYPVTARNKYPLEKFQAFFQKKKILSTFVKLGTH